MKIQKNIAAKLRAKMRELDMSQTEFSDELGIPRSSLQGYLKQEVNPRADTMEFLAERLGCSLSELVTGDAGQTICEFCPFKRLMEGKHLLHPALRPFAEDLQQLLLTVLRFSDLLYEEDAKNRVIAKKPS